jgi:uncharacterized membrane protein
VKASDADAGPTGRGVERTIAVMVWAAVIGLGAWSAWQRWLVMESSPYPIGIDGYYYAIQLRGLVEDGALPYPASPLAFWLMWPLAALTDPITGAKLGAAIGGAAVVVPAFLVGRRLGGVAGGLAAAVAAATTGGSFYLSFEFVKNGLGLTIALLAVWLALRAFERPARGRIAAAVAAVVATALTHKLAAGFVVALLAPAILVAVRRRSADRAAIAPAAQRVDGRHAAGRNTARWLAVGAAALLALAIVLGAVMPERFVGARELDLAAQAFDGDAEWTLPALVIDRGPDRPPVRITLGGQVPIAAVIAVLFAAVAAFGWWWRRSGHGSAGPDEVARPPEAEAVAWAAVALIAITCLPWLAVHDPDGLGFRLRTSVFAPLAIVTGALVGRIVAGNRELTIGIVFILGTWLAVRPPSSTEGLVRAHPAMVAAIRAARGALPADAVVITAERHLGFQLAWYAHVPVRMRPDRVAPERRWRLLPGALIGFGSPLDRTLGLARATPGVAPPLALHPRHPAGLVLVPEATWAWILDHLPARDAAHWRAWPTI